MLLSTGLFTMASATEGKIMSESFKQCGSCKANTSTKYCTDCNIFLCSMCNNIHKNIPLTQYHNISDIQASTNQAKPKANQGRCSVHNDQPITCLCKDCVKLICNSCKTDHAGHELLQFSDDPKVYHKICGKHIQQLIEDLHEIEELKSVLEGHITIYNEATVVVDKWELDLFKMVKDKAEDLRQRIKHLRGEKIKLLGDKIKGLMEKLQEIDMSITKLTDIRKSMDTGILAYELSKSKELIRKLDCCKSELSSLQLVPSVDKMLPHGDKIKDINGYLDLLYSFDDLGRQPVAEWIFTQAYGGKDLGYYGENPVTMTNVSYCPGPEGKPDTAVFLPKSKDQSIIVMNPTDTLRFKRAMTFYIQVYLQEGGSGFLFIYNSGATSSGKAGARVFVTPRDGYLSIGRVSVYKAVTLNCWHNIAVTMDTSSVSVYVDGKHIITEKQCTSITGTCDGHIHIGRSPEGSGLSGKVSRIKFFDVALTENEIQKLI